MYSLVVYYSRGGKTRKIADAIAQEMGCEAVDLKNAAPDASGVDLLMVGSGNYCGIPHKTLQDFMEGLQPASKEKAAVFATSGGPEPQCIKAMKEVLETKGYEVISSFDCRGQFFLMNRGHPDEDDLKNAKAFANELREKLGE